MNICIYAYMHICLYAYMHIWCEALSSRVGVHVALKGESEGAPELLTKIRVSFVFSFQIELKR